MKTHNGTPEPRRGKMPRSSISFPAEVYRDLERIAEKKKVSVAWVVRQAVEKYLGEESPLFQKVE